MPDPVAEPDRWSGFDTPAHRSAQAACRHLIRCAVDATIRRQVSQGLEYARHVGDAVAVPLMLAQLTGPCCLPPKPEPEQRSSH
jgi:hypothetical protein